MLERNPAVPKRLRREATAGRIVQDHRPCFGGSHRGPLLSADLCNAQPDPLWHGSGVCQCCGDFIHHSQLRRAS